MPNYDFDLITIGGGSGGVRASRFAAQRHGKKVARDRELADWWHLRHARLCPEKTARLRRALCARF